MQSYYATRKIIYKLVFIVILGNLDYLGDYCYRVGGYINIIVSLKKENLNEFSIFFKFICLKV